MASYFGGEFDAAARKLRKQVQLPVKVRTVRGEPLAEDQSGLCVFYVYQDDSPAGFVIYIHRDLTPAEAVDTLIHEVAHARDFERNGIPKRITHRQSWGKEHARMYCVVHGRH